MSDTTTPNAGNPEPGFWRLRHADLAALLARTDLTWETVRVYLALADPTIGWGKKRDVVSLSQIAKHAGMFYAEDGSQRPDCSHVSRALRTLAEAGLCGSTPGKGQRVVRWVTWPPPQAAPETAAEAGTTATHGSSATAGAGSGAAAKPTAEPTAKATAMTTAGAGRHQDVQEVQAGQDTKREGEQAAAASPSLTDSRATASTENDHSKDHCNANDNGNNVERLLAFAFPSGKPPETARATCIDRIAEAVRLGATYPLLAYAVRSPKAKGSKPWERIEAAGQRVRELIDRAKDEIGFRGETLAALLEYVPVNGKALKERAELFQTELRGWRKQATEWPG
jgi:hypothetical protein